jgi:hypothetical protein
VRHRRNNRIYIKKFREANQKIELTWKIAHPTSTYRLNAIEKKIETLKDESHKVNKKGDFIPK